MLPETYHNIKGDYPTREERELPSVPWGRVSWWVTGERRSLPSAGLGAVSVNTHRHRSCMGHVWQVLNQLLSNVSILYPAQFPSYGGYNDRRGFSGRGIVAILSIFST